MHNGLAHQLKPFQSRKQRDTMPALKTYRLFISHSWTYGDAYEKLVKFFDEHPNFTWVNYSVPKDDPIHNAENEEELYEAIKAKIAPVN
jgi:O-acetylhomoserine/O-acetylserine sulfhydrylase-like pyridoxal-dependent enzyme